MSKTATDGNPLAHAASTPDAAAESSIPESESGSTRLSGIRPAPPSPPPAQRALPFFGREHELAALDAQLGSAFAGTGSTVMLVGDPGIGKTATAQRFAVLARGRGVRVLWGRCFEGEWSPSYGPWVDVLARHTRNLDPTRLRLELGLGAPPLARLVPSIRAALPDVPAPAPLAADAERVRVEDAIAQFVLGLAVEQPLVLVLDDLHWADPASIGLLRYLSRFLAESRLVIVGTYRDAEVDNRHPLTAALADLRRAAGYVRLSLVGLSQGETSALLAEAGHHQLEPGLARAIHEETAGNPFFAAEVFRHLLEAARLEQQAGEWRATGPLTNLGIPESVRQVVGRRLLHLSATANRMLSHAAIFTDGFVFPVLQELTGIPEEELLDALDEALASGLVRTAEGPRETYDFVHDIVRHTVLAELSPSRKVRLHRRLAEAMETVFAGRELDHAAELAAQYHASAALPGAAKGIYYALAAAEQAKDNAARDQSVMFLRMARDLAREADFGDWSRILCRLAIAEAEALHLDEAQRSVQEAMAALTSAGTTPEVVAGFLAAVAAALKDGGVRSAALAAPRRPGPGAARRPPRSGLGAPDLAPGAVRGGGPGRDPDDAVAWLRSAGNRDRPGDRRRRRLCPHLAAICAFCAISTSCGYGATASRRCTRSTSTRSVSARPARATPGASSNPRHWSAIAPPPRLATSTRSSARPRARRRAARTRHPGA